MAINEDGKVVFSEVEQAEVNRIVQERVARAKAEKPEDYDDLTEIAKTLEEFGYSGTPSEKKSSLKAQREEFKKQQELEELQQQSQNYGTGAVPPEILKEIKELQSKISELSQDRNAIKEQETKIKQQQESWKSQIKEFEESHPDVDLEKLDKNEKFVKFAKKSHPNMSIKEVYENYIDIIGDVEAEAMEKFKSKVDRSTSSGKAKGDIGGTHGLTPNQMRLSEENGMSYKEYAGMMKLIK